MDCRECIEDLTAFQDGELSPKAVEQLKAHLRLCPSCAAELQSLRKVEEHIESTIRELEPGSQIWNLVRARISARADSRLPFRFPIANRWRIAVAALAIMLGCSIGYLQYQQTQQKNLDAYIAQYIREREAGQQSQSLSQNSDTIYDADYSYTNNLFAEAEALPVDNPFRSED
jgi:anti-sigma factor RsiW